MTPLSNTAPRFGQHIELLQEYFAACGVDSGSPEDLAPFLTRISQPGVFRSETGALLRTIMYRENLSLSHEDLVALLYAAAAGAPGGETPEVPDGCKRDLLPFVHEVMRSLQGTGAAAAEAVVPSPPAPAHTAEKTAPTAEPDAEDRFARAAARVDPARRSAPAAPEPAPAAVRRPRPPLPSPAGRSALPSRPALIVLAALLLLMAAGFLISHRTLQKRAQQERAASAQAALDAWPGNAPAAPAAAAVPPAGPADVPADPDQRAEPMNGQPSSSPGTLASSGSAPGDNAHTLPQPSPGASASGPGENLSGSAAEPTPDDSAAAATPAQAPLHSSPRKSPRAFSAGPGRGLTMVSSGILSRNLLSAPAPEYPKLARLTHTQGQVILQAVVGRDGNVLATHVLRGHYLLRGAAEKAVRRWRYRPYLIEGQPTTVATVVTVDFLLRR
jgi:TonB family protein